MACASHQWHAPATIVRPGSMNRLGNHKAIGWQDVHLRISIQHFFGSDNFVDISHWRCTAEGVDSSVGAHNWWSSPAQVMQSTQPEIEHRKCSYVCSTCSTIPRVYFHDCWWRTTCYRTHSSMVRHMAWWKQRLRHFVWGTRFPVSHELLRVGHLVVPQTSELNFEPNPKCFIWDSERSNMNF